MIIVCKALPAEKGGGQIGAVSSRSVVVAVFLVLLLSYVHQRHFNFATPVSRLDLLQAVVEEGTLEIDRNRSNTPDVALWDGHYDIDRAPGTAAIALPGFALGAALSRAVGLAESAPASWLVRSWLACVVSRALPAALGAMALWVWLARFVTRRAAFVTVLGLWFGSLPLPYATWLYSHAQVIGLLAIAVWGIDLRGDRRTGREDGVGLDAAPAKTVGVAGVAAKPVGTRDGSEPRTRRLEARTTQSTASAGSSVWRMGLAGFCPGLALASAGWGQRAGEPGPGRMALSGFCLGLALASEYTAGIVVLGIAIEVALREWRRRRGLGGAVAHGGRRVLVPRWAGGGPPWPAGWVRCLRCC